MEWNGFNSRSKFQFKNHKDLPVDFYIISENVRLKKITNGIHEEF